MARPLVSESSTLQFLTDQAAKRGNGTCGDPTSSQESLAREYGFESWTELIQYARNCCVLLDKSTLKFTRKLRVDLPTAWKFISVAEELSTWMFETKLELRVGGRFEFPTWGGVIEKLEHLNCIRFRADEGGYSEFQIESAGPQQTAARVIDYLPGHLEVPGHVKSELDEIGSSQPGGPGTHWAGVLAGWHSGSDSLEAYARNEQPRAKYGPLVRVYSDLVAAFHNSADS